MDIIFAGTPEFSVSTLQALITDGHNIKAVYTQPDRPAGRGRKVQISPVKQCAINNNLTIEQPLNFKTTDNIEQLKTYHADLMVVVAYGIILPIEILTAPKYGCINIHASLLPRWRGAAPIQRSILNGDKETGVTLMQMDEGLDTGDMLEKSTLAIKPQDNSSTLHDKLAAIGAQALIKLLPSVEQGCLKPIPQDSSEACYANKLTKQEATIDWHQPAHKVLQAIAAFNPWPVAHTQLSEKPLRIWSAQPTHSATEDKPGTIIVDNNRLYVACLDENIEITELQPANKRKMEASAYLSAHKPNKLLLT